MDVSFCIHTLEEALAAHGTPEIFNTDQGSQFTSLEFTQKMVNSSIYSISAKKGGCCARNKLTGNIDYSMNRQRIEFVCVSSVKDFPLIILS
jgi:hypothetical protein